MSRPLIVAMGGFPRDPVLDALLSLARGRKVLYVGTAAMESADVALHVHERLSGRAEVSLLRFSPWPPDDLRGSALGHDVILVGGGNTANMLAVWRVHGFDGILREAWEAGIVLAGWSAGAICWFEASVTDSFGPQLAGMQDGLGFIPGSACPHYDGEEFRRPVYRRLVDEGFPAGIAIDDDVGAVFAGTELEEVVSAREGATAYRVSASGEERLAATLVT